MKLNDVVKTFLLTKRNVTFHQLYTTWGEQLDTDQVLEEYPRPQLKRENYTILNGYWNYSITKEREKPGFYDGRILVPFSPESVLSGVGRQVMPEDYLWYERVLFMDDIPEGKRCILHFGAVDQYCEVFINSNKVKRHVGGYLPFSMDITRFIGKGENTLSVKVRDFTDTSYHNRGKQKLNRGGMFYTAQSGIWQTVWLEWVPEHYIETLKITPDLDNSQIHLEILMNQISEAEEEFKIRIYADGKAVKKIRTTHDKISIPIENPRCWSPEDPFLYSLSIEAGEDRADSYFALRKCEVKKDSDGVPRLFLNNAPYFHNGILDQGYWPDGLYTPPSDEAMIYDIQKMKELGFNMIRKHIKIEPSRWYYHCDRLGMIVWQDMINGGGKYNMLFVGYLPSLFPELIGNIKDNWYCMFGRLNKKGREEWNEECRQTVTHLYNHPSILVWVPFNEGWGQFDSLKAVSLIRSLDKTRLIDQASGWFDQKGGDFRSIHNYLRKLSVIPEKRAVVLSEFAGYACYIKDHTYSDYIYGYRIFNSKRKLNQAIQDLYQKEIPELIEKGLSAAVFTQLADVEDEVNGVLTYDRKVCKITRIQIPQLSPENEERSLDEEETLS